MTRPPMHQQPQGPCILLSPRALEVQVFYRNLSRCWLECHLPSQNHRYGLVQLHPSFHTGCFLVWDHDVLCLKKKGRWWVNVCWKSKQISFINTGNQKREQRPSHLLKAKYQIKLKYLGCPRKPIRQFHILISIKQQELITFAMEKI